MSYPPHPSSRAAAPRCPRHCQVPARPFRTPPAGPGTPASFTLVRKGATLYLNLTSAHRTASSGSPRDPWCPEQRAAHGGPCWKDWRSAGLHGLRGVELRGPGQREEALHFPQLSGPWGSFSPVHPEKENARRLTARSESEVSVETPCPRPAAPSPERSREGCGALRELLGAAPTISTN